MNARKLVAEGKSPVLEKQREKRRVSGEHSFGEVGARYFKEARMADSTRSMRKAIFDPDIEPAWKNRRLSEISPDDLRQLCGKVKERGAPATAIHVRDIVKQIFGFRRGFFRGGRTDFVFGEWGGRSRHRFDLAPTQHDPPHHRRGVRPCPDAGRLYRHEADARLAA